MSIKNILNPLCISLLASGCLYGQVVRNDALIQSYADYTISAPPESLKADTSFYRKYCDAQGIPILSSDKTPDDALLVARDIVNYMLAKRTDIRESLVQKGARVLIIAFAEGEMDLPERRNWKKPARDDRRLTPGERDKYDKPGGIGSMDDRTYWNGRARGMGGTLTSCAEENLLGYPSTRYYGENILVHEFSHNIMGAIRTVDPEFYAEIGKAYEAARASGMYKGQYAINTKEEYWAEGSQWWFGSNFPFDDGNQHVLKGPNDLKNYDPVLYGLLEKVYRSERIPADVYGTLYN
ncbi:glycoside hydrolase [Dyadobacter psychrotolerans]|uniref:Glycoside hydrolase n=1 Tax=Dyadobacter psychrotolerans TaxID=2541721 RepID=A0A4R5DTS6_9BACT|nr:glycoside hydrolase [Dyadobacter psychrotolerans]TDE17187.1 glycoside hydrolase [Dyadobacter psychrotolerans]